MGQRVDGGQVITAVGNDRNFTGCHLHFGVYDRGGYTDPMLFLAGPDVPVWDERPVVR